MNPLSIIGMVISFFSSPVGKWVGYGLIAAAVYGAGDIRGRRVEHAKCEAAARAAQEAANRQDDKAKQDAVADANATISDLTSQKDKANADLAALQAQLRTLPLDAPCLYGAGGRPADRVRDKPGKGAGDAKHPRAAGVPAAGSKAPSK